MHHRRRPTGRSERTMTAHNGNGGLAPLPNFGDRLTVSTRTALPRMMPVAKVIENVRAITIFRVTQLNQLTQLASFKIRAP